MTAYHEFGHYVDHQFLGMRAGGFGSSPSGTTVARGFSSPERLAKGPLGTEGIEKLKTLMKHIKDTDSYKTLTSSTSKSKFGKTYVEYVSSDEELFARAFAQYVAEKANDKPLQAFMRSLRGGTESYMPTSQWSTLEMKDMIPLFDDLFEELAKQSTF